MAHKSETKKWMLEKQKTVFQEQWTEKWCFVENKSNVMRVSCKWIV